LNISSLIPNPLDFSRLSREDVGLPLLRVINSLPESLKHRYNYLTQPGTLDGYTVSDPAPVKEALNEAWGWLLSKGFIAPKPDDPNSGFVYVTQEGRKYLENMQAVEKMAEDKNLSVRPQVEGVIPGSKLSLGDTFLRFPLWARAALASRCAARVMPLFIPNVDHKREETRRAVIALDACWKLAGLASQGRFLAEDIVDRVASAIKFAQDAIKDERSPSYDAVEIAALAAQSGGYAHDLRPSVLMNIVTRHELAFSRLAGATGLGSGISIAATTSLNADISELETQTETKELSSEMKARAFFKEPLWRGLLNPSEINQMTAPWHMRLLELDFLDLYNSYMPMLLNSAAINWNMAIAEIRDWASGLSGVGGGLLDHEVTHSADALISAPVTDQLPNLGMLADVALEDDAADLLGYKAFAEALAGIIDCPDTSTPFVLSINAPWGAGKSTLALMIKRILTRKPSAAGTEPHVTCWFNAWMHDDAPNLASAFAAEVAQTADRKRPFWRRFIEPLPRADFEAKLGAPLLGLCRPFAPMSVRC
jgi:hypothetical protein